LRIAREVFDFRFLSAAAIGPYPTTADFLKHFPTDLN